MKKMRGQFVLMFVVLATTVFVSPQSSHAYIAQTNSAASVVIGQVNYASKTSNQGGSAAANTLGAPFGSYSDGTKLIVPDYWNSRVLIYNTIPTSNNAQADVVIGQVDMTSSDANQNGSVAANTLNQPTGVFSDGTKLFICDYLNSRILIYNSVPTTNNASADVVVGQANMISGDRDRGGTVAVNSLDWPREVYSDGTKLFIIDTGNHRALIYNTIPTSNGVDADVVVGQSDFTSAGQNQNRGADNPLANTISQPGGIMANGGKLFITDSSNSRVLIYNSIPTTNDTSADVVIGQADMVSSQTNRSGAPGRATLAVPSTSHTDGTRLFVADNFNSRILIYNTIPTSNGASADVVIGQPDFASTTSNQGGNPGADTINGPRGMFLTGNKLIISESSNNRVLIFDVSPRTFDSSESGVGPISINSGADSTATHQVQLTINAVGAKEIMVSNNADFSGASWEVYVTKKDWDLSSGNSIKTTYVKFRDFANFESATYSDYIELPSLPETGKSTSNIFIILLNFLRAIF